MATSIGSDFPNQIRRCTELLDVYKGLGTVGTFGAMRINSVLENAKDAWESGDVIRIAEAYQELSECE